MSAWDDGEQALFASNSYVWPHPSPLLLPFPLSFLLPLPLFSSVGGFASLGPLAEELYKAAKSRVSEKNTKKQTYISMFQRYALSAYALVHFRAMRKVCSVVPWEESKGQRARGSSRARPRRSRVNRKVRSRQALTCDCRLVFETALDASTVCSRRLKIPDSSLA